jgi:hypothetical protein
MSDCNLPVLDGGIVMRSYEAARSLFSFLGFLAWSVIIIGIIMAMIAGGGVSSFYGAGPALIAAAPGIGIALTGFILVAFVQMGRATVDTAEYTQQMLKISRDQLQVSKQSLKTQNAAPQTFAAAPQTEANHDPKNSFATRVDKTPAPQQEVETAEPAQPVDKSTVYKGKTIRAEQGKYLYGGIPFATLLAAKDYIDSFAEVPARKLPGAIRKP